MTKIDHYDTIRECIDEFGSFGTIIWLHGWTLGAKFEWIYRQGHLLTYLSHKDEVLSTRKIAYHGRFQGYQWDNS